MENIDFTKPLQSFDQEIHLLNFKYYLSAPIETFYEIIPKKAYRSTIALYFKDINALPINVKEDCASIFAKYFPDHGLPVLITIQC